MPQPLDIFAGIYRALTDAELAVSRERASAAETVGRQQQEIERLKTALSEATTPDPGPVPADPVGDSVPFVTVFGVNRNRNDVLGRTPVQRDYYQPSNTVPATFDHAKFGTVTEQASLSFKVLPADVLAGKWDARFNTWLKDAAAKLPRLVKGRRHLLTVWHEPAKEIRTGLFTAEAHGLANVHLARLILKAGLQDVFGVALCYTISKNQTTFDPAWVPQRAAFPAGVLVVLAGDCYGNPYPSGGKTGLDTPYPDPGEDLAILWAVAKAKGFAVWAVWEFNAPRRTHDDAAQAKRIAWLTAFVLTALTKSPSKPYELLFWEGQGEWDQRFGSPEVVAWAKAFVARSPRILAAAGASASAVNRPGG